MPAQIEERDSDQPKPELASCRYCGSTDVECVYVRGATGRFRLKLLQVCCYNCEARGPAERSGKEARRAWGQQVASSDLSR
jgi:hypothetical protein